MNEVIRDIFKKDFEVAEVKGRQDGSNEEKERVATDMLRKRRTS